MCVSEGRGKGGGPAIWKDKKSLKDEGAGESIYNKCQERKTTKYLWDIQGMLIWPM